MSRTARKWRESDFSLTPKERAIYGATITARSLETGQTRTFARTDVTALEAVAEIVAEIDLLPGDFRVLSISTPVSIQRDMYASRITLVGQNVGLPGGTPEQYLLGRLGRSDLLHPMVVRMSDRNVA